MAQGMKDIVLFGKEAVARGTKAATFPLDQPILAPFLPTITNHLGEVLSNSTWPYRTDQVPLGTTASLSLTPEVNRDTIRDLLTMATKRTNGDQSSVSITHTRAGVGHAQYLGAVVSSMNLEYSRSGSPDASSLLQATMGFECMTPAATTGVVAGTKANARRFKIGAATFTIAGVSASKLLSYRHNMTIAHAMGAPLAGNVRQYLEDGDLDEEIVVVAQFNATDGDWFAALLAGTEITAVIVHGTGTANETVTATIGKAQISGQVLGEQEGTLTAEITIKPFHTGSAEPTVWTYGSSIGASVLSL